MMLKTIIKTLPCLIYAISVQAGDDRLGLGTHWHQGVWPDTQAPLIPITGSAWVRDNLNWNNSETSKGVYTLPSTDQHWLQVAQNNGLKVDLCVLGPNNIYTTDPEDPTAFAAWISWITTQMTAYPCVQAIEILNEPNNNYSQTERTPGYTDWRLAYVNFANKAYAAIKAANSHMVVIGAGSGTSNDNIFMIQNGLSLDGYTDHPYQGQNVEDGFAAKVASYRAVTSKPLWFTEYGKSTQYGANNSYHETENQQAIELLRQTLYGFGLSVEHQIIYEFGDDGALNPYDNGSNFGIWGNGFFPKQMYYVLQRIMPLLEGTYKIQTPDQGFYWGFYGQQEGWDTAHFYTYAFSTNTGAVLVYWFGVPAWTPEAVGTNMWYINDAILKNGWSSVTLFDPLSGVYTPMSATHVGNGNWVQISNLMVSERPKLLIIK